ncbi:acyl-CoA thioesterase [Aromatoleum petrolei]|uniref:Acyl-CoA thioesterase II n=1 Tax=Aromatoleum petrolei TaxID=76116 RepID=A0ABX1MPL0_9RHOO|nr:acyl-CoA thioesterase domain-containing protein [Aromatoleum petrolei]NMF88636.1 acyl-CoA thioesterase II [Aromatoleum petrolei]QTQ34651.1 Acyl-CoA thioesterase [Aromatoleum petrolei]
MDLLSLRESGVDRFANQYACANASGTMFGGQLIGQAMMATLLTVPPTRAPHAFHGFFLRSGNGSRALDFDVERVRDGRSFSHRRVVVSQDRRTIFTADVSFHEGETGDDQAHSLQVEVPPPEALPSLAAMVSRDGHRLPPAALRRMGRPQRDVDVRIPDLEALVSRRSGDRPPMYWLRVAQALPDAPCWHTAALGYLSDCWLAAPFRMLPGAPHYGGEILISSLDHALWIHRPFRADHWLLMVHEIPTEQRGRRFNRAQFFDRDGRLVASSAQEALMRLVD